MRRRPVVVASLAVLGVAGAGAAGLPGGSGPGVTPAAAAVGSGCTTPAPRARGAGGASSAVRRVARRVGTDPAKRPRITSPRGTAPRRLVQDDVISCRGRAVRAGATVRVRYVITTWARRARTVDSSWDRRPTTTSFRLDGGLIAGWREGLPGMRVGERRLLVIPPSKAYGAAGTPDGAVPRNATLLSVVDLVGID